MFIGHFAVGFAAKKLAPRTSLGTLLLSVGFLDVLWPFFLLAGWEHARIEPGATAAMPLDLYHYPYSHSLVAGVLWSVVFSAVYFVGTRYGRGAVVVGFGVLSHWLLDLVAHRPDLPLWIYGDGPKYGLGLWNHFAATLIIETLMWAAGVAVYVRMTRPNRQVGTWSLVAFVATLYVMYLANLFGPPPPSIDALAYSGPIILALYAWPYWIDRNRSLRSSTLSPPC